MKLTKGLTLIELTVGVILFVILVISTVYIFRAILLSWSSSQEKSGMDTELNRAVEEIVRELREAKEINDNYDRDATKNNEIRFAKDRGTYYIYYFYNKNDSYGPPPSFDQPLYELKREWLSGGMSGTFTYGSGKLIITDVLPPPVSNLSVDGNEVTVDLSISRNNEIFRLKTRVRPRNL